VAPLTMPMVPEAAIAMLRLRPPRLRPHSVVFWWLSAEACVTV